MRQPHVLVVEDDLDIATMIEHHLTKEHYRSTVVHSGRDGLDSLHSAPPDAVLLDLMLPDMSGLELLKQLRRAPETQRIPVVVLTAKKDEVDRILGFELGADDYVTKPFSPRELVLRIRAVLQRTDGELSASPTNSDGRLEVGPISIDLAQHRVEVDGEPIELTLTEFKLLQELVRARGRVRSREGLLSEVWGYDSEVLSRTVDTHVRRLRSKLGPAARWLSTVRGLGYRIQSPDGDLQ